MDDLRGWVVGLIQLVVTCAVLAVGVAVTYFLVWHVIKFMCEGKGKKDDE